MDKDTKNALLSRLRAYACNPDDDIILIKEKIKAALLQCPELLYALNNNSLEDELFDKNGELLIDGEWDRYFGDNGNIRPFVFFPQVQTDVSNYVCYKVEFTEVPRYNSIEKYTHVTFVILVSGGNIIDKDTGIPRHDLLSSIIRERFNWSNIFGTQCKLIENKESITDTNYVTRTLVFELTSLNAIVKTNHNNTSIINNVVRK